MAANGRPSMYTCPRLLNPRFTATLPNGDVVPLREIDTIELFFGEHRRPCYGGSSCDNTIREENTQELEKYLTPHRRQHLASGGNSAEEFPLYAQLMNDKAESYVQAMRICMQKERDWMSIHPNAEPYPYTTPLMYDTRGEEDWMARHPNVRPGPNR